MTKIQNPILRGFNPDPSIVRVGEDYYIATSTFEWYPGVQIHHSKDLVHWQLVTRPLRRKAQLDMMGEYNACGIWAPCLSYAGGTFYLIYTNVVDNGTFENYMVTTEDILGEWSDPIYLNNRGFDTSLFHDDDGKKWYLCADVQSIPVNATSNFKSSMALKQVHMKRFSKQFADFDLGELFFRGISLQEFDPEAGELVGEVHKIFRGTELGITEAPHLFKRNGFYYLMVAEGGTGFEHAVTFARSKSIFGPYEVHPQNPILTSFGSDAFLTRAGHADLVETQTGEHYLVHLCSRTIARRPDGSGGYSILGRETGIQKMEWRDDDWLWLAAGGNTPQTEVEAPDLTPHRFAMPPVRDDFDETRLGIDYQWLRGDYLDEIVSLTDRPGWVRLFGKQTVLSRYQQALIARRQQELDVRVETAMDFVPMEFGQMAGLLAFYNLDSFYYLYKSVDEAKKPYLSIMSNVNGEMNLFAVPPVWLADVEGTIYLRLTQDFDAIQFSYSLDGKRWQLLGKTFDAKVLSDEFNNHGGAAGFTGNFFAIACHDPVTKKVVADFDYFDYEELK